MGVADFPVRQGISGKNFNAANYKIKDLCYINQLEDIRDTLVTRQQGIFDPALTLLHPSLVHMIRFDLGDNMAEGRSAGRVNFSPRPHLGRLRDISPSPSDEWPKVTAN